MENILNIVAFVKAHWVDIAQAIAGIIGVASVIVKLTPNTKDDAVLGKIIKFVSKYIALNK